MKMSKEALRIYNRNARKVGKPLLTDDSDTTDAQEQFEQQIKEVTPYTTGLQTDTDDPDYAKNIKQELDWISNSTQYLFNAVDAAQDTWNQATQAQQTANDAYDKALANAQDIIDIQGDISGIDVELGSFQDQIDAINVTVTGIEQEVDTNTGDIKTITGEIEGINGTITGITTEITGINGSITTIDGEIDGINGSIETLSGSVSDANASATEALSVANSVSGEYSAQWGIKETVGDLQYGVGLVANSSGAAFVVDASEMIFTDGTNKVSPFSVTGSTVYMSDVIMKGSDSDGSIEITNTQIIVKDGSGKTMVILGKVS